jgi:uncharacterized protein YcnI
MKRFLSSIFTLLLVCCISSCVEYVNLDSDQEMPVVVNCVLTRDTVQVAKIYRLRLLSSAESNPIEDAEVLLQEKDKNGDFKTKAEFKRAEGINWEVRFQPEYGTDYRLVIKIPGENDISATTEFPDDLRLIQCSKAVLLDTSWDHLIIGTPTNKGYTMTTAEVRRGKFYTEWKGVRKNDGSAFKAYIRPYDSACVMWVFPHTDSTDVMPRVTSNQLNPDIFQSKERSVTILDEEYYTFNGTDKPYSKLISTNHPGADRFNIAPGSLMDMDYWKRPDLLYGAMNYSQWCYFMHLDFPIFNGFVRIEHPENFNNGMSEEELNTSYLYSDRSFFIAGDHPDDYSAKGNFSFINEVHFVSKEYDKYLRELYIKMQDSNNFILNSYDYSNVYTNVVGGVGIFGADNVTWDVQEAVARKDFSVFTTDWKGICPEAPEESFW